MSRNHARSSRSLLFAGILLFTVVGFAAVSATIGKLSLSAVILVLVAFAEAGLIIFGLITVQNVRDTSVTNQGNV
jgi:hypothetical protein